MLIDARDLAMTLDFYPAFPYLFQDIVITHQLGIFKTNLIT
jgi:hypothetical protein